MVLLTPKECGARVQTPPGRWSCNSAPSPYREEKKQNPSPLDLLCSPKSGSLFKKPQRRRTNTVRMEFSRTWPLSLRHDCRGLSLLLRCPEGLVPAGLRGQEQGKRRVQVHSFLRLDRTSWSHQDFRGCGPKWEGLASPDLSTV